MNGPYDEIGLDVTVSEVGANGLAYPTISYYANGIPKLASYTAGIKKSTGVPETSWENDAFTGNWDVCFVPTASTLLKDNICIAQPHNTSGIRTNVSGASGSFTSAGNKGNGTVRGNGTTNPILGYAIRSGAVGYLEIAQRK